jgi:hypothetical protein
MAFCRTVGQAIFHTAGTIGPSTIDRSKLGRFRPGAGVRIEVEGVVAVPAATGVAAGRSVATIAEDHNSLPRLARRVTASP